MRTPGFDKSSGMSLVLSAQIASNWNVSIEKMRWNAYCISSVFDWETFQVRCKMGCL